ncbi:glycosyltransferase family 2 protein [Brevundimonas sp.]|uniref:glycosyltransferase family 2 protein n=1 Tax=Brevundimonas sp. TaxID=1871086 RepID=UPI002AB8B0E2|nr:glycosyltransferase family 2 protein [Brevundimonas sp.]MDZ4363991.1 glycosyltransferase family 2 protein [Brevundimonas sp.]
MTGRPTLAAVAIAKNERRDIVGFIDNVRRVVDEVVIVDDGSTDGTLEFLRTCGMPVTIIERRLEPEGGFAAQRNTGLDAATADWLIHMDIDERITPDLARDIHAAIADMPMNGFRYRRLNFFLHRPFPAGGWQNWNNPQLGRRGHHRFVNAIHEAVEVEGGDAMTGQLSGMMWHLNDDSYIERIGKNVNYAPATARGIMARGRVRWWHLLTAPMTAFLKAYVLRGAWRHGTHGLIFGLFSLTSRFNHYATAWDIQNQLPREELERQCRSGWPTESGSES